MFIFTIMFTAILERLKKLRHVSNRRVSLSKSKKNNNKKHKNTRKTPDGRGTRARPPSSPARAVPRGGWRHQVGRGAAEPWRR